jgi:AraC-like DNA-binding protein
MQYGGMLTTVLLALTVAFQLPRRTMRNKVFGRARWMMAGGLMLIAVQFLLQYIGGYRQMGITQAVFWNLIFFIPCNITINLALLYVQQKGRISPWDWNFGGVMYLVALTQLIATSLADGVPFEQESEALRTSEYVGSALFLLIQSHYFMSLYRGYRRMQRAVDEYYDRERKDLLGWMGRSVTMLAVITLFVPVVIFQEGWMLTAFACAFFAIIYYCASCFHTYGISQDLQRVEEAEEILDDEISEITLSEEDLQRVGKAIEKWVKKGGYRKPNLTLTSVATELDVQRYLLKAWLQNSEFGRLNLWLNHLRVMEARRLMKEKPTWSMDIVAEECGLSLSSFHRVFRQNTGMTPFQYQRHRGRVENIK